MRKYVLILRALAAALALCLVCGSLGACSQVNDLVSGVAAGEFPVEVDGVTIHAKPQRVAVLSPSLADVVLALGCETQLAGGAQGCTQQELRDMQKVDPADAQAVAGLNPDLVLLDPSSAGAEQALRDAGCVVLNVAPAVDRRDYERLFAQVSTALNGGGPGYDQGIAAAQNVFTTLDDINRLVPGDRVTTACYLYDLNGQGVTGDMLGSTIMTYSGVTNAFKSLTGGQYDYDSLRVSNPDFIFCAPGIKAELESDSRFSAFQAVREGNVVELEPRLMEWQGRTIVECALEICGKAFPELLEENSMKVTDPTESIDSAVSSALASPQPEDDPQYETLEEGDQGDQVLAMQSRLDRLGYLDTDYDGHFGEYTASCLRDFQRENGLEATGVADPATQRALFADSAKAKPSGDASGSSEENGSQDSGSSEDEGE
ncbi:MAG: ABC transporter substrate-binding protein [Acutalibacter sp.]|nr:ABC transporter substrate-binding protein [Acutalibacter sp.]